MKYPKKPIEYTYTKLPLRQRIKAWWNVNDVGSIIAAFIGFGIFISLIILFYIVTILYL